MVRFTIKKTVACLYNYLPIITHFRDALTLYVDTKKRRLMNTKYNQ